MNTQESKSIELRVIFAGTSSLAKTILESLITEKYNIVATITQSDKKAGRKKEIAHNPVKQLSTEKNIPVLQPEKLDDAFIKEIKNLKPDLIIVAAYGKILPQELLEIPGFGSLNVHPSLLPKLRGPSPIQNALLLGNKKTGITIMLMDAGMDTGNIISQYEIQIESDDTTASLTERAALNGSELLLKTIPLWVNKKISSKKQNDSHATLCQLIEKADGKIIWSKSAQVIYNQFRALYPWPGIFCFWQENEKSAQKRIKFLKISTREKIDAQQDKYRFGEVYTKEGDVFVQTPKGSIMIERIQLEGKPEMDIKNFINGYPNFIGSILK